jgi:predicted kinase
MKKPLLLATFAYPGSGKTYFSERLAKKLAYFHLSSDKIRLAMFRDPKYTPVEHETVFRFMDYLAEELLQHGVSVIYDANFNKRVHRSKLPRVARRTGAKAHLIWIQTSEEVAMKRLEKRAKYSSRKKQELYRPITKAIFEQLRDEMERPAKSEKVIKIDGHLSFSKQFEQFKKQVHL